MSIEVHNPHMVNSLVADAERHCISAINKPSVAHMRGKQRGVQTQKQLPVSKFKRFTEASKIVTEDIEKECYKQLLCNETLYRELTNTEHTFVKSLDDLLNNAKRSHNSKYNLLYNKWEDSIYSKLQGDIQGKLGGNQSKRLDSQKRKLFSRYLDTCNAKGTVFLDVISREEYNPLSLASRSISTRVPSSRDPTKLSQTEDKLSWSIEQECGLSAQSLASPTARGHVLSDARGTCNEWIGLPLRDVDSSVRQRTRGRMMDKTASSKPTPKELNLPKRKPALPTYQLHRPLSQMFF